MKTQIWLIGAHQVLLGHRFESLWLIGTDLARRGSLGSLGLVRFIRGHQGHRFGSSGLIMTQICFFGVIVAHYKGSSRLRCGSSGLKFGSLGLIRTQVSLIGGHCCSSGLNIWLIWTH